MIRLGLVAGPHLGAPPRVKAEVSGVERERSRTLDSVLQLDSLFMTLALGKMEKLAVKLL